MVLKIYKGFDKNFLNKITDLPLLENDLEDKIDIIKFDKKYSDMLQISMLQKQGILWMTYEEYMLIKEFIEIKIKNHEVEVLVIKNNLYPGIYPVYKELPHELVEELISNFENDEKENFSELTKRIVKIYSEVKIINNKQYIVFYNDEIGNDLIKTQDYFDRELEINSYKDDVDYIVDISGDLDRYIEHLQNLESGNYKTIGVILTCNTKITDNMFNSFKAYFKLSKKWEIFKYEEQIKEENIIIEDLKRIAKNVIKIKGFEEFRKISIYKDPTSSNETIEISQSTIMKNIIEQAENAIADKTYRDVFITAPTGAGKSVIFQIPAVFLAEKYNSLTIIIVPIKELMFDQYEKLHASGYNSAAFLNSDKTLEEKEKIIEQIKTGEINLLYLSPETLLSYSIESIIGDRDIGLVIVDEAHIVTTWGVGFRPDYWYLGGYINKLRKKTNKYGVESKEKIRRRFPICAFTATAVSGGKEDTISDTIISLYMEDPIKYIGRVKRDNIKFDIVNYFEELTNENYDKQKISVFDERVRSWVENKSKTIVYFPYHKLAQDVFQGTGVFREFNKYHANFGIYTGQTTSDIRRKSMEDFKNSNVNCMLATKAFGMGIDIDDVNNVYHYAVSGNLNDYVQEIGRAARKKESVGYAITDYYNSDMKYMNKLFGMSQIRHFHIMKVLSIIHDVYHNKQNRNFLITPKMFAGIFGNKEEEIETKLKIVLLMLEKDFYDKYGFKVLISRPRSIFTNAFVVLDRNFEEQILNSKYSKYLNFISKGRNREETTKGTFITDFGDVYLLDLKGLWEDYFPNMSFPSFKYDFFSSNGRNLLDFKPFLRPRLKTTLISKNDINLSDVRQKAYDEVNYITSKLKELQGKYFGKEEFEQKIRERYGNSIRAKVISNTYLELIDEKNACFKSRTLESGSQEYILSNSLFGDLALSIIGKSTLLKEISDLVGTKNIVRYLTNDPENFDMKALKLLSILDIISYEVLGGDSPEIFIRLNDPRKIEKIVYRNIVYYNDYVDAAKEKHNRSVKILNYFFRTLKTDSERWNFIEEYFLGKDVINSNDSDTIVEVE